MVSCSEILVHPELSPLCTLLAIYLQSNLLVLFFKFPILSLGVEARWKQGGSKVEASTNSSRVTLIGYMKDSWIV